MWPTCLAILVYCGIGRKTRGAVLCNQREGDRRWGRMQEKYDLLKIFDSQYTVKTQTARKWESISGNGSSLHNTRAIREKLPALFENLKARSLLDVPCGDRNWIRHLNYPFRLYIGGDLSSESLSSARTGLENFQFVTKCNICTDQLPKVDVILCRDALVHLDLASIRATLRNFKASESTYLLTTTFTQKRDDQNRDIIPGRWRPLNLQEPPFNFPPPLHLIDEGFEGSGYTDKSLALWALDQIPDAFFDPGSYQDPAQKSQSGVSQLGVFEPSNQLEPAARPAAALGQVAEQSKTSAPASTTSMLAQADAFFNNGCYEDCLTVVNALPSQHWKALQLKRDSLIRLGHAELAEEINGRILENSYPAYGRSMTERFGAEFWSKLIALNRSSLSCGVPIAGNLFYNHHDLKSEWQFPHPYMADKRKRLSFLACSSNSAVEIGLNAGHSALLILSASPGIKLSVIDIGEHKYVNGAVELLKGWFGDRFEYREGDSSAKLREMVDEQKCFDLAHIDGAKHKYLEDIGYCLLMTSRDASFVIDDSNQAVVQNAIRHWVDKGVLENSAVLPELKMPVSNLQHAILKKKHCRNSLSQTLVATVSGWRRSWLN